MSVESKVRAVTTLRLKEMKDRGEKISMLTSYDYSMAKIVDKAGVDVILVGAGQRKSFERLDLRSNSANPYMGLPGGALLIPKP